MIPGCAQKNECAIKYPLGLKAQSFISVDRHLQHHHIPSVRRSFITVHVQTLLLNTDPVDTIINQIIILWSANISLWGVSR